MSPDKGDRLFELVERARELQADERDAFLVRECDEDLDLLREARELLAVDVPSGFVEPPRATGGGVFVGDLAGRRLGDFRLEYEIGRGGMGVVYRSRQLSLDRDSAVKVLPSIRRTESSAFERFQREARAASKLRHEALIDVLASGETEGLAWYAMPFVDGHDLFVEIEAQRQEGEAEPLLPRFGTPPYVATAVERLASLAEGLQHAHENGVIHRDVKPRNILLDGTGRMFLTDFGLAKVRDAIPLTGSRDVQGTPFYMSPEQARALQDPVTERSDVYSLCIVLFELLTLRRPYEGSSSQEILHKIASGTHIALRKANPRVPRDLAVVCEKGMAHRPKDRYASAVELAKDLQRFVRHEAIVARPPTAWRRLMRWRRKHPVLSTWIAAAVLLILAGVSIARVVGRRTQRAAFARDLRAMVESQVPTDEQFATAWRALGGPRWPARPGGRLADTIEAAELRLEVEIGRRLEAIDAALRDGAGPRTDARFGGDIELQPDPNRLLEGIALATESATLFPRDFRLAERADVAARFPRVDVELGAPISGAGEVLARRVDHITGTIAPGVSLGPLPVDDARVAPGSYRFVVVMYDGRFAELERHVVMRAGGVELVAWPRSDDELAGELVPIDPPVGGFDLGDTRPFGCVSPGALVALEPYSIGGTEVSNGAYVEFLRVTGTTAPAVWGREGFDVESGTFVGPTVPEDLDLDRWRSLAATAMSYPELRAYAEWRGCRVPTHFELEFAQRGPGLQLVPLEATGANVDGRVYQEQEETVTEYWFTTASLRPVHEPSSRTSPHGLYHSYGNVAEWTSSHVLTIEGGLVKADPLENLKLGRSWRPGGRPADLSAHATGSTGVGYRSYSAGLRLARSWNP